MSRDESTEHVSPASLSPGNGDLTVEARESDGHKEEWQCPYCDHSLRYRPAITDVAELAIRSHMERRHPDNCDH